MLQSAGYGRFVVRGFQAIARYSAIFLEKSGGSCASL
jgi:hypothetical protein